MTRKRDMDLIRSLMLEMEEGRDGFPAFTDAEDDAEADATRKRDMHLQLIKEADYVVLQQYNNGSWAVDRITGKGHDFLDSVRDPAIWEQAKEGATKVGGFTLELIAAAAKGYLKKQFQSHMGFDMEF